MDLKDVVAQVYFRQGGFGREKMGRPVFFARYELLVNVRALWSADLYILIH